MDIREFWRRIRCLQFSGREMRKVDNHLMFVFTRRDKSILLFSHLFAPRTSTLPLPHVNDRLQRSTAVCV